MTERPEGARPATKIVLSDLHLGAGRYHEGNRLEEFTKDAELAGLLRQLAAESDAAGLDMELILNGDVFEFWQVPALDDPSDYDPTHRYPIRSYLTTYEEHSRSRMEIIVQGHREVFATLAGFMQAEAPRRSVTIVKGNHDVQLHWPAVQGVIRRALRAEGRRAELLTFPPRAVSRDGIYVEHGSEYADRLNRHPCFEHPVDPRRPNRLRMVPGGPISIRVLNRLERDHYWISSVKPIPALVLFLLRFDWRSAARLLLLMLPHLPKLLWLHRPMIRSNRELAREVARMEREGAGDPQGGPSLPGCYSGPDVELLNLPSLTRMLTEEEIADDPLLVRGLLEEHHLHARLLQVARLKARQEGACVVLFGHTHVPAAQVLDGRAVYINTGSWTWMLDLRREPAEAWRRLIRHEDTYDVHYHLTYARVDYSEDGLPQASLREVQPEGEPLPG